MREYRNSDTRTNNEESDPCIAAEIRMKKSVLTTRGKRNLVALLVILGLIASLSVLLFLIIPRPKKTSEQATYKGYDLLKAPAETTTVRIEEILSLSSVPDFSKQDKTDDRKLPILISEEASDSTLSPILIGSTTTADKLKEMDKSAISQKTEVLETSIITSQTITTSLSGNTLDFFNSSPNSSISEMIAIMSSAETTPKKNSVINTVTVLAEVTESTPSILRTQEEFDRKGVYEENFDQTGTAQLPDIKTTSSLSQSEDKEFELTAVTSADIDTTKFSTYSYRGQISRNVLDTTSSYIDNLKNEGFSQDENVFFNVTSANVAQNCQDLLKEERIGGVYTVFLPGVGKSEIVCDMINDTVAWNVIQRRYDGSVDFANRSWKEYEEGFGDLNGSFWLGLRKIHAMVLEGKGKPLTLRIEIRGDRCNDSDKCSQRPDGFWFGEWDFKISSSRWNYSITLSPAKAGNLSEKTLNDKFYYMNNGQQFTTIDRDNDRLDRKNCALFHNYGGWWHNDCGYVALNGYYGDTSGKMRQLFWQYSRSGRTSRSRQVITYNIKPRYTEMKVRL